jgi:hypothetical protein
LVENLGDVNQQPQRDGRERATRESNDGLAAVAITLLAVALVILMLTKIV